MNESRDQKLALNIQLRSKDDDSFERERHPVTKYLLETRLDSASVCDPLVNLGPYNFNNQR